MRRISVPSAHVTPRGDEWTEATPAAASHTLLVDKYEALKDRLREVSGATEKAGHDSLPLADALIEFDVVTLQYILVIIGCVCIAGIALVRIACRSRRMRRIRRLRNVIDEQYGQDEDYWMGKDDQTPAITKKRA